MTSRSVFTSSGRACTCPFSRRGYGVLQSHKLPDRAATPVAQPAPLVSTIKGHFNSHPGTVRTPLPPPAAAAAAEPAADVQGRQKMRDMRDLLVLASFFLFVALSAIVVITLAFGGGLQVWRWLLNLHESGVEAATWAEVVGLVVTVVGGVWLVFNLVLSFAQASRGVEELKLEVSEKQQELKLEVSEKLAQASEKLDKIESKLDKKLDMILSSMFRERLDKIEGKIEGMQQAPLARGRSWL